MRRCAEYLQLV